MSKSSSYLRVITAGLLLSGLALASACGGDDDDDDNDNESGGAGGSSGKGGSGGTAGTGTVEAIECGSNTCEPLDLKVFGQAAVAPCCVADDACGLDSSSLEAYGVSFDAVCQPRDQPGVLDSSCPDVSTEVPDTGLVVSFKGCCRPVGQCGYMLDKIAGAIELGLGCVASEPFLDGGSSASCDPEGGGGGGGAPSAAEGGAGGG